MDKKQQSEPDMKQQTSSKLGKDYIKAVYCHPFILIAPWSFVQLSFGPHPETGSTSGSSSLVSESAGGLVKHGLLSPKPTASDAPGGSEA